MSKFIILFLPVFFSATAQLLVKVASGKDVKSASWFGAMGWSLLAYFMAFILYSIAVRQFPVSIVSPINTIAVMLVVTAGGALFWGEAIGVRQIIGILLGGMSLILLLSSNS